MKKRETPKRIASSTKAESYLSSSISIATRTTFIPNQFTLRGRRTILTSKSLCSTTMHTRKLSSRLQIASILRDQQGATAILIGVAFTVLLGFLALAIDMGYLWVAQNELQNAADAGSLAGARFLTNQDGSINVLDITKIARIILGLE